MNKKIEIERPELHPVPVKTPWHHLGMYFVGPIIVHVCVCSFLFPSMLRPDSQPDLFRNWLPALKPANPIPG